MGRLLSLGTVTTILALSLVGTVRGDQMGWTYNWTPNVVEILADAPGTGTLELTDSNDTVAADSTSIVAVNLKTLSVADPEMPDTLASGNYTLDLMLTDNASMETGTLSFGGALSGSWSTLNSDLANEFTSEEVQSILLGENLYQVTIGGYSPPGPPDSEKSGSISAFVEVFAIQESPPPDIQNAPEPGSLTLASFALLTLGVRRLRRRA